MTQQTEIPPLKQQIAEEITELAPKRLIDLYKLKRKYNNLWNAGDIDRMAMVYINAMKP